jgi:hypothetical protein
LVERSIEDKDLKRRIRTALRSLGAAIDLLTNPPANLDLHAIEAPPDKIAAEAAILIREIASVPDQELSCEALRLAGRLRVFASSPRIVTALAIRPAVALDLAAPHVLLSSLGICDADVEAALTRSLRSDVSGVRERLPHRALEQDWLDALRTGNYCIERWVADTAVVRGLDLLGANRDDLYAFTHALAYSTDFGRWQPPKVIDSEHAASLADSALAAVLDADDFDLAAELLLTWPCLGLPMSNTAYFAFQVLKRVEDDAGILPSLSISMDDIERQPPDTRSAYATAVSYHTAFVMGILCAVLLRRKPEHGAIAEEPAFLPVTRELLNSLKCGKNNVQWMSNIENQPESMQAEITPFLMDIALFREVRNMKLASARDLLLRAITQGVPGTFFALQVSEALSRIAASQHLIKTEMNAMA